MLSQLQLQPANKLQDSLKGRDLGLPLSQKGILFSCSSKGFSQNCRGYCLEMDLALRHLRMLSWIVRLLEQLPKKATGSNSLAVESGQDELRGEVAQTGGGV